MKIRRAPVASEGFVYIGILALLAWATAIVGLTVLSFILALLAILNVLFFRDPERNIPDDKNAYLSPADGVIILVEDSYEKDFLNSNELKISISLAVYDCHINRMPVTCKVAATKYTSGSFHIANMPSWLYPEDMKKKSEDNERLSTLIKTSDGKEIVVTQIAGFLARRIVSYAKPDMEFKSGERFGMIKFGSRVDLYLPEESLLEVKVGQRVWAGETILARMGD
ncbi:MAG: phosphatidylserine decarboxylase proenzyme [Thermodesulfobacteriota bacterium]|nr:MAG: phosphatidylserine decarboxylase proenzyme [Thermodesulfobacteriota bacterium]